MARRPIIEIDDDLCNGCGQCILSCQEGALELVEGKARLVGEIYCDGLGACLGECPTGALTIVEREADEFDEAAVEKHLETFDFKAAAQDETGADRKPEPALACGCPGSMTRVIETGKSDDAEGKPTQVRSELGQWPIKLQLLGPRAPFLKGADLLLLADCVAVAYPDLHRKFLKNYAIAIGCPKLDNLDAHIQRLTEIIKGARPRSLTVAHMEVPCCRGFVHAAEKAVRDSGLSIPVRRIQLGIQGEVKEEEEPAAAGGAAGAKSSAAGN